MKRGAQRSSRGKCLTCSAATAAEKLGRLLRIMIEYLSSQSARPSYSSYHALCTLPSQSSNIMTNVDRHHIDTPHPGVGAQYKNDCIDRHSPLGHGHQGRLSRLHAQSDSYFPYPDELQNASRDRLLSDPVNRARDSLEHARHEHRHGRGLGHGHGNGHGIEHGQHRRESPLSMHDHRHGREEPRWRGLGPESSRGNRGPSHLDMTPVFLAPPAPMYGRPDCMGLDMPLGFERKHAHTGQASWALHQHRHRGGLALPLDPSQAQNRHHVRHPSHESRFSDDSSDCSSDDNEDKEVSGEELTKLSPSDQSLEASTIRSTMSRDVSTKQEQQHWPRSKALSPSTSPLPVPAEMADVIDRLALVMRSRSRHQRLHAVHANVPEHLREQRPTDSHLGHRTKRGPEHHHGRHGSVHCMPLPPPHTHGRRVGPALPSEVYAVHSRKHCANRPPIPSSFMQAPPLRRPLDRHATWQPIVGLGEGPSSVHHAHPPRQRRHSVPLGRLEQDRHVHFGLHVLLD